MINTIIFDMDGLLIDSEPFWRIAETEVFATVGIQLTHEMCLQTMGMRTQEMVQFWYNRQPWENKSIPEIQEMIIARLVELIHRDGQLFDGVINLLDDCYRKNINMAICSSSDLKIIKGVVEKFELEKYFTILQSAEFEPLGKPHPGAYLTTMKKLNVTPKQCIVFEDSVNGAIAGKASGAKTIAIPSNPEQKQNFEFCHAIYDTMKDVKLTDII